jgi:ferrous iron transport protein B
LGLVGNQNAGKTTLFNALTGMNASVGNWPGVTIERKEGFIKGGNDLLNSSIRRGSIRFSPYTDEEKVTRKFCLDSPSGTHHQHHRRHRPRTFASISPPN